MNPQPTPTYKAMTTREKFEAILFDHGIRMDGQRKSIMDFVVKKTDEKTDLAGEQRLDWNAQSDVYDSAFYAAVFMVYVRPLVVEWIDANLPLAWYRPLFANETLEMKAI